jgi:hypothetical protein
MPGIEQCLVDRVAVRSQLDDQRIQRNAIEVFSARVNPAFLA